MGRSLGKGMREFKESISGRGDDADDPPELDAADDDRTVRPTPREHDAVR
jgi:Sec-independent protein translocase protein TatA